MGTLVMDDVRLALKKGYRILEIYEFYEYQSFNTNPKHARVGFSSTTQKPFELKAEASGYSGWVRCSEDEEQYVEAFCKNEGIRLDREIIKPNAAKRV